MDIAALSSANALSTVQEQWGIGILKKALDMTKQNMQSLPEAAPCIGEHLDILA